MMVSTRFWISESLGKSVRVPLKYMKAMQEYVEETRTDLPKDSEIQNLVDTIMDLINATIYKLENLK